MKIISLFLGLFCLFSILNLEAKEFLRIKILSNNLKPGDAVVAELFSDYQIQDAVLLDTNRRLPCLSINNKWFCIIGIPADFNSKDNLFIVTVDVKTEPYFHIYPIKVAVGKKSFPKISWSSPWILLPKNEFRASEEKDLFRKNIEKSNISFLPSQKFVLPLNKIKKITAAFGERRIRPKPHSERIHNGVDLRARQGEPILAPNDALVEIAEEFYFEGNFVLLNHGGGIKSDFMHLSEIAVKAGDSVSRGQIIGYAGQSGAGNTSPHLHFEIWVFNTPVDPMKFIKDFNYNIFEKK